MKTKNDRVLPAAVLAAPSRTRPCLPAFCPWLLAILLGVGFGCGRGSTYNTPDGEVKVDKSKDQITVKTKDGEVKVNQKGDEATYEAKTKDGTVKFSTATSGVALPDNFPKDIPIYKGAKVQMASSQPKVSMVQLLVDAAAPDAAKYYQDELKAQGWEIESTTNMGDSSMVVAKKENRSCSVMAMKQDNGSLVQIAVEFKGS